MGEEAATGLREGDLGRVGTVGGQLWDGFRTASEQARAYEDGLSRVIRMLALTPGRPSLEQLIRLMEQHGTSVNQRMNERFIASLLAEGQRPADLIELLYTHGRRRDGLDELRSCLFHELLLRGADVSSLRLSGRYGWSALTWLPQDLRPFETDAPFPIRKADGSGAGGVWTGSTGADRLEPATPRSRTRLPLPDRATVEVHEAIVAAPTAGDFGCSGAWVFAPEEPVDPDLVPALVPDLPMPCVEGLGAEGRFEISRKSLAEIWRMLFSTASEGGVYAPGAHGAYGRRAAWWSLAGLSGAPLDATAEEVERHAEQSTWFRFECDTEWFHNEIYDYGIVALSPDRRRISVLAVTDTD